MTFMPEKEKESSGKGGLVVILIIITLISLAGFFWSIMRYQQAKDKIAFLSTPEGQLEASQVDISVLLEDVRKIMLLPTDIEPTVATVQDAAALANSQPFFTNAQNGDKVLIYQDKAILYSPVRNIIVNVAPVQIEQGQQQGESVQPAPVSRPAPPPPPEPELEDTSEEEDG